MKTCQNPSAATFMLAACIITANTSSAVTERFTSSGTFTPLPGITSVTVECWGGGGAGGAVHKTGTVTSSANNAIGGGGAGGAYARRINVPVTPGVPYTVTIPAAATNNTLVVDTRVNGANVTFTGDDDGVGAVDNHICTAVGGEGGETAVSTNTGNVGLAGSGSTAGCVGDVFFAGGNGGTVGGGGGPSDLAAGINANSSSFALGSDAIHNGGLGAQNKTGAGLANDGGVPGAGGGGSRAATLNTSFAGGKGARGQIIITYFGATLIKANNPDNLSEGSSWVGGNAPELTGIAKWDNTVTSANTTVLGADLAWGGITIADPVGLVTIDAGTPLTNTLTNNGGIDMSAATADLTLNCGLALGGPAVWNVAASRTLTVGGIVSGAQAITKQGAGKVILSAANTYSGATAINGGSLQLGATDVLPHGSGNGDVSVAATCTLDLNGYSDSINGLSGAGIVDNTAASTASTLTVGGNNASSTFSGVIQNSGLTSALNLVKTGSGTLTLSGPNTFSGTATVNGGRLAVGNLNALSNMSGLTIGAAQLGIANVNNLVISAPITLTGNLLVIPNGSGVLLTSLNGPIGGTGTISFTTEANSFGGADTRFSIGASGDFAGNIAISTQNSANNMTVQLGATNALPATAVVTLDGGNGNGSTWSDLDLFGFSQTLAGLTNVTRTSRLQRVYNANTNPAVTLTINNSSDYTFEGGLGKTGDANFALTKSDIGTFTLTGNNPFFGATKITAGILSLGNALALQGSPLDTLNSIAGDATNGLQTTVTTLTLGGLTGNKNLASVFETTAGGYSAVTALTLNPGTGASHSYSGGIADGAVGMTLTKSGAGTQTLSGPNSYTGATAITAGTLALGANNVLPDTAVSIGAATLDAATFDDTVGTLDVTAAATLNLGVGANLAFATGSPAWAGTLAITGTFVPGNGVDPGVGVNPGSLRFGTNASGLTLTQLGQITGLGAVTLDAYGYLISAGGGNTYADWLIANAPATGFDTDTDKDGIPNGVENVLGSNPNTFNAGLTEVSSAGSSVTYKHTLNPTIASDVNYGYEWSTDLTEWKTTGQTNTGLITGTIIPSAPVLGVVTVTITTNVPSTKLFGRIKATGP